MAIKSRFEREVIARSNADRMAIERVHDILTWKHRLAIGGPTKEYAESLLKEYEHAVMQRDNAMLVNCDFQEEIRELAARVKERGRGRPPKVDDEEDGDFLDVPDKKIRKKKT